MSTIWRPSEIIVNNIVKDDPITLHFLSQCPNVPVKYVDDSRSETIRAASDILSNAPAGMLPQILQGKLVVHLAPASSNVVDKFVMEDSRMMCPEFDKLVLASNGCYYNCDWCFLKATYRANQNYITVRVQYDEIKKMIEKRLKKSTGPVMFDTGEMADSLSMEHLTKAGQTFIPWFAEQENGYMYMLTKSDNVNDLLKLAHKNHTIIAWSLNADLLSRKFEIGAPVLKDRLAAAKKVQNAGYPVRVRLDPIIPIPNWKQYYAGAIKRIFAEIKPERITIGTLRFEEQFYNMREKILNSGDLKKIVETMQPMLETKKLTYGKDSIGKYSFSTEQRIEIFQFAIDEIRKYSQIPIALCKESKEVWEAVKLDLKECKCVCQYDVADMTKVKEERLEQKPEIVVGGKKGKKGGDTMAYENRKLYELSLNDLKPDPNQPRKYFEEASLEEMRTSIEKHGVITPILFRKDDKGNLILVAGERRYRASLLAGKDIIPGIYTEGNAAEIALVENLLREDLNPIEEAEALQHLKDEQKYTNEQLSAVIGKAPSTISEILSLNKLPKSIKKKCRVDSKISRRTLVEIAKGKDEPEMKKRFKQYEKKNLTGDALRETTRIPRDIDSILMTMAGGLYSKLNEVNLTDIGGQKRTDVETKLRDLIQLIEGKLNYNG